MLSRIVIYSMQMFTSQIKCIFACLRVMYCTLIKYIFGYIMFSMFAKELKWH